MVPVLPKKYLMVCENYDTISLLTHPRKILLYLILKRIVPKIENFLAEEQAWFGPRREIVEQMFNLHELYEKVLENDGKVVHDFIDSVKAFNSIWHKPLWVILQLAGAGENVIRLIQNFERCTMALVFCGA